jgi:pimeloyl-ACP methyl ester carboxylesterase
MGNWTGLPSVFVGLLVLLASPVFGQTTTVSGSATWNGYERLDFAVRGRKCLLVLPTTAATGRPWVWRTEFFGHEPQADLALLARGYAVGYVDVQDMYGAPVALDLMDAFYAQATSGYRLGPKVVLEGFSRGGLFAFNWAARNPEKVACIYADAPVCDFKSWPGGRGKSKGSANDWRKLLAVYGMTEQQALDYRENPVDHLKPLADAHVPVLSVCGLADADVPFDENTGLLAERYKTLGGPITVITKPFGSHHPHSLKDPAPIVDFVLAHTPGMTAPATRPTDLPYGYDYHVVRSGLNNARVQFERHKTGRVVFLGGSITDMKDGWRDEVCRDLRKRFPETEFDFVNAGIPSLGSTPGAFRFARDVLAHGPVDLLIEEAAVNDEVNGQSTPQQLRGMEGIVRQALLANAKTDVLLLHFVDPPKMEVIRTGKAPAVIANHERVAEYYGVPSIDLAREVTERIHAGQFTWEGDFKNLHPSPFGHGVYARSIARLLDDAWGGPLPADAQARPHAIPDKPLDEHSYFRGRLVAPKDAAVGSGWELVSDWAPADKAGTRPGFVHVPVLVGEQPGTARLNFSGNAVGLFVVSGPDAGMVEYSVDGAPFKSVDLYTQWSGKLHLPWAQMLAEDLREGRHELVLRVGGQGNPKSTGHAVRVVHFLVNGRAE